MVFVVPLGAQINMDGTALYDMEQPLCLWQIWWGLSWVLGQQIIFMRDGDVSVHWRTPVSPVLAW